MMLPETSYVDREIEKLREQIAKEYVTKLALYRGAIAALTLVISALVAVAVALA